jgi:methionine-rich copper-binding protein CopC
MKKLLLVFLPIILISSTSAYSTNTQFVKSTPADGSVSATPPSAFVFEFSKAVRFQRIYIKKDDDKEKQLNNLPNTDAAAITVPAPSLTAGHYVLNWSVFTQENRVISGRIRFTVSADSVAALP